MKHAVNKLDKRTRGTSDKLKLSTKRLNDSDWAFADLIMPSARTHTGRVDDDIEECKKVIACMHNMRTSVWEYRVDNFPGFVDSDLNLVSRLNAETKWNNRKKRYEIAKELMAALAAEIDAPQAMWSGTGVTGVRDMILSSYEEEADRATSMLQGGLPNCFFPAEPRGLVLPAAMQEVPATIPGKLVSARGVHAPATLEPPKAYKLLMNDGKPRPRILGLTVDDGGPGQWRYLPFLLKVGGRAAPIGGRAAPHAPPASSLG